MPEQFRLLCISTICVALRHGQQVVVDSGRSMSHWRAMMESTASALDTLVAEQVMDFVPCDAWEPTNLGSAGGPVLPEALSRPAPLLPAPSSDGLFHPDCCGVAPG